MCQSKRPFDFSLTFAFLKSFMPVSPQTGQVEFLESLTLMPQINEILIGLSVAAIIIVPLSIYRGYKIYIVPPRKVH